MSRHRISFLAAAVVLLAPAGPAAAAAADPDWPCVQIQVPSLSAGQIWSGDPVEGRGQDWHDIPGLDALMKLALDPLVDADRIDAAVEDYAATLGPDRNRVLTALFAGLFDTLNRERGEAIGAIHRYARQQRDLLAGIDADQTRLGTLPADSPEATALRDEIGFRRRVLDERRRYQTAMCDQPVRLEQRLGLLARTIAAHLE